jgi:RNA polymerase sigma factor (TIGR02999 family)
MEQNQITQLLNNYQKAGKEADEELYSVIYSELKKTARSVRRKWQGNLTMNTTSLVHETYLKISPDNVDWQNRLHFFYFAGKVMRQILYNYAEKKMAMKRGGHQVAVDIDEAKDVIPLDEKSFLEILCLENILKNLEKHDAIYGKIIECRFYSGMTIEETAKVLQISEATIKRKWSFARAWLYKELKKAS